MQRSLKSETVESIVDDGSQNKKVNSVQWDIEKGNVDSEANHDGVNVKTEPSNERLSVMRQQFAVAASGTGSSSIEDRFCCTNMALKVYKKAWEGARKALPRATRNRLNNTSLDNNSSVDQRRAISNRDPNRTISLDSEDDPATECSFEYDEDGDLRSESGDHSLKRRGKDVDRPTTLRGLERLSTDTEEFGEDETNSGPEDVDLESFKRVYMSDLVIPEEPDKESAAFQETSQLNSELESNNNQENPTVNSEGSKWKRRFKLDEKLDSNQSNSTEIVEQNNNTKLSEATINENIGDQTTGSDENKQSINEPDKPMSLTDIERFVQVTCDQVMEKVRDDMNSEDDLSIRGSGIFKIRPGIRNEDSIDSRASTDVTISSIDIPTITITEDQLDDSSVVLSEATLRDETGSEGACDELPEDGNSNQGPLKGKATALKFKVKKLGSKVKDIFKRGTTPEVSPAPSPVGEYIDIEEEKRRRKEEEKDAERKRKEEENARKEEEKKRKEEAERRRRDEELEKKALEMEKKAELEAAKERERQKKEEAKRRKEEEKRIKEEEKRMKEEEERLRKEEEKARKEEEKARKEEEKARKEEEKRLKAEEEKRRKEEEKRRKEEEKMRKMKEEEERKKLQEMEEKKRKQAEEEERRIRQLEEEEERRRKRQEEEEEKEQKRRNEEESAKLREKLKRELEYELLTEDGKDGDDGDTKDIAGEDESVVIKSEQDDPYYNLDGNQDNTRRASSPSLVSGHASVTESKSTSQATIMVTSPTNNREKRSPSRDEETFGQAGESEGDVEPQMDGRKRKKMRKRLRDTKNKLINLKSKALESLPSISTLKNRVKEILPVRSGASGQDENGQIQGDIDRRYSIHREQKIFSEYRKRYPDSENEFFSDSELVESRKSTLKALSPDLEEVPGGMYDEIETSTEDRVQLLLSPINSPLRPPRRSDYGVNSSFHASEPNISRTGTPKKPKRAPPPRPPPPEVDIYLISSSGLDPSREGSTATSLGALEDIDLNSSNRDLATPSLMRNESDRIPASIYYRNVVRDWQERHNKRMDELISASSPNLEVYQQPPRSGRHPPRPPVHPISGNHSRPQPLPRRRLSRASLLRQKIREQQAEEAEIGKENIDGYEVLEKRDIHSLTASSGLPPLPPPRFRSDRHTPMSKSPFSTLHRLQLQKQQQNRLIQQEYLLSVDRANLATDGLYWKPFSWKTGRCRSLTELYVRKRSQPPIIIDCKPSEVGSDHSLNQEPVEKSLSYRLMSQYCSPPRPPPPTITTEPPPEDLNDRLTDTVNEVETSEPIYSTIDRSKKLKRDLESNNMSVLNGEMIQNRPLPAPPLPPRSKRKNSLSRSRSNSPYLSLAGSSVDLNRPETTLIRPVSPYPLIGMVDVSVETGSQLIDYPRSFESKECQTSLEDLTNKQLQTNFTKSNDQTLRQLKDMKESYVHLDCTEEVGYADDGRESITPTPTTVARVAIKVTPEREVHMDGYKNDLNLTQLKRSRLSSSSSKESSPPLVTASSGSLNVRSKTSPANDEASSKTITHYYDAEECDTDMDTFADLDSLSTEATQTLTASTQFHSVLSEPQTISSSITGATSHYDTDQASSKTMEIPTPPEDPAPQPPTAESTISEDMIDELASSSSRTVPLVAEHVTIDEDSDDDMLQPRVASPSEMRAYMSRRRMRPDSMDASDSEW